MNWRLLLPLCLLICILPACVRNSQSARSPSSQNTVLQTGAQRADPGYVHYLERQSMLGSDAELARIVSGSHLPWLRQAASPDHGGLIYLADTWLTVNPLTLLPAGKQTAFAQLANPVLWENLRKTGIKGVYVGPTGGAGGLWAYERKATLTGEDVIQYKFSEASGDEEAYQKLLNSANMNRSLLGTDLIPASTGLGPDFFLAVRNLRDFPGAYCLIEVPPYLWPALPAVDNQWHGVAIGAETLGQLSAKGVLPPSMRRDSLPFGREGGWAATAEIRGVDGQVRRWIYRFDGAPDRPILNWEDPSSAGKRIFSGSAIQQVGLLGNALVGLSVSPLLGLEAAPQGRDAQYGAEPALTAAREMGREVRRYGGWSWLKDELPMDMLRKLQNDGPDLFLDSISSPAAEHALLTGDATLLHVMLDEAMRNGIDIRRTVHRMPDVSGISYELPHLSLAADRPGSGGPANAAALVRGARDTMRSISEKTQSSGPRGPSVAPVDGNTLHLTGAGLAAMALGAGDAELVTPDMHNQIMKGHLLLAFYKALQPGVLMLSGQDLAGSLPLSWQRMVDTPTSWDTQLASRGAYSFTDSASNVMVTGQGIARAQTVYPAFEVQVFDPRSFSSILSRLLGLRSKLGVAQGQVYGRFLTTNPGTVALIVLLPSTTDGSIFADESSGVSPAVPRAEAVSSFADFEENRGRNASASPLERLEEARRVLGGKINTSGIADALVTGDTALLVVCNFSRKTVSESLDISVSPLLRRLASLGAPTVVTESGKGGQSWKNTISLNLEPWQGTAILIGKGAR